MAFSSKWLKIKIFSVPQVEIAGLKFALPGPNKTGFGFPSIYN